jgi:WD repeat-containing protein 35
MTAAHVIVASRSSVYIWNHLSQISTFSRAGAVPSDEDRVETSDDVFHIHIRSPYDERSNVGNTPLSSSATTGDPICSVAASDNILLVGLQSGVINQYNLRQLSLDCQHLLKCRPRMMSLNCVSTSFSVIDMNGTLTVYDITASSKDSSHPLAASEIKFERKDVWDMRWSEDDPELFALMEKTRMYIFRGTEPEEPVLSSAYICEFRNLQIKAVLLDDIMQYPEKQSKEYVINFETKSLRDTRNLLQNVSMQDAYQFVEDNSHPRLWHLLAEHALDKLNLVIAEKAFVQCSDYHGIQFVKQLQTCDDVLNQQAQIASYFKRFDDAEKLYAELDRLDLAIEMRMHLGDWFKVEKLVQVGAGDDNTLTLAWNNIGHYFADRKKWSKAVAYFAKAKNVEKLADCFYALEDFLGLDKLVNMVPEGHVLLRDVAKKFVGVGLCESAVKAYLHAGDVKAAIDSCVILNQWDKAVELAERHNFQQIEALLGKYAGHLLEEQQVIGAIDLFRKANKHNEVASLLTKLAKSVATSKGPVLRAKKLHVLAALEATKFRHRALVSEMPNVTRGVRRNERTVAAQTLDGLMTLEQVASENSAIEGSWRGAEAFHFLLLAHRQLFDGQFEYARRTSLLLQDFEDLLDSVEIYSLIAITSYFSRYYGRCSKAFVKLESAPDNTKAKMAAYKKLATAVFLKVR